MLVLALAATVQVYFTGLVAFLDKDVAPYKVPRLVVIDAQRQQIDGMTVPAHVAVVVVPRDTQVTNGVGFPIMESPNGIPGLAGKPATAYLLPAGAEFELGPDSQVGAHVIVPTVARTGREMDETNKRPGGAGLAFFDVRSGTVSGWGARCKLNNAEIADAIKWEGTGGLTWRWKIGSDKYWQLSIPAATDLVVAVKSLPLDGILGNTSISDAMEDDVHFGVFYSLAAGEKIPRPRPSCTVAGRPSRTMGDPVCPPSQFP